MSREVQRAERIVVSYIRWRNPPEPAAGMGGIFPGEGHGRVNYRYLNWLNAYYVTMRACLNGKSASQARNAWPNTCRALGLLDGSGGQGGVTKAIRVWFRLVPSSAKYALMENVIIYNRILRNLRSHIEREVCRLGGNSGRCMYRVSF